jgi:hypothetical protein
MMKRMLIVGLAVIAAACTTSVASSGPPSAAPGAASPTTVSTSGPSSSAAPSIAEASPPDVAGGDAAALCAIVIDINTRAGYMVDKTYMSSATMEMFKQVTLESLARRDEIMSVTPPEIRDAVAAELDYFKVLADWANQNGWDGSAGSATIPAPPADYLAGLDTLNALLKTRCGIKFP